MSDRASELERLAEDLGRARSASHPAVRAQHLAQMQRLSGWALRDAITECREIHGMTWRDAASSVQVPFGTLYRQYQAGGRIVVGECSEDAPSALAGPGLEFLVLGELVVRSKGADVHLPGPSVRALLSALLLTSGDIVGEWRLLELAWGIEKGSRGALQCAVHRLRAWLGGLAGPLCRLEHTGSGYRLAVPAGAVDIIRFRELVRAASVTRDPEHRLVLLAVALGEWRGPVLGGRPDWLHADPAVRGVEQTRVDCAGALADLAFRLGRAAEVVPLVGEVAATAPYDEPLQARYVRLLSACGRPAEALRQVEQVRQRLADDLGIAPSGEVRSAHATALQSDDRFAPIPRQLPPDVPDFTARDAETEAISELLLSGRGPLAFMINGPAGVGKTALAVHLAHRMAALFVNGQLYADLRRPDERPVDPAEVLGRFLRDLGVGSSAIPDSLEDRAALYRSLTAGRRVLVLLDNAVEESQVRPLVPGAAECAVLITSRVCLTGLAGARLVRLGMLGQDEAVRLLGRVCGRDEVTADPAAPEIVRLCDYLPLAVRIAGIRLATRPQLSVRRLAARLRDESHRLDELAVRGLAVRQSLERSYRDLAPDHRRTFRLLGLLPGSGFAAWSAAAQLGTTPDEAAARLEALVDARLLDPLGEDAEGQARYGFSDLVRLYARELKAI